MHSVDILIITKSFMIYDKHYISEILYILDRELIYYLYYILIYDLLPNLYISWMIYYQITIFYLGLLLDLVVKSYHSQIVILDPLFSLYALIFVH